ncbi:F-box/WD repeat-containing protein 8 isoform X2 [Narcine bancroftii]|uniref:F-box/WD repeat-containing protein 8 isoform X2 n=1 Tax=Narcine bancroftii TaxID=1343680 RepID=UPI0038311BAF
MGQRVNPPPPGVVKDGPKSEIKKNRKTAGVCGERRKGSPKQASILCISPRLSSGTKSRCLGFQPVHFEDGPRSAGRGGAAGENVRVVGDSSRGVAAGSLRSWTMGDKDLAAFRQQWKDEISGRDRTKRGNGPGERCNKRRRQGVPGPGYRGDKGSPGPGGHGTPRPGDQGIPGPDPEGSASRSSPPPDYFSLAESLLEGRTSPLRHRIQSERRRRPSGHVAAGRRGSGKPAEGCGSPPGRSSRAAGGGISSEESLLDQLISDLNEVNEIPFFDIDLPYELALRIFAYLGRTELGRCAQVSKTWKIIAEDEVLWYKHCLKEGYQTKADIGDFTGWKAVLRDSMQKEETLQTNWKNRIGATSQLHYDVGGILCDAHSYNGMVVSGYTSGDVRMWDISTWDSSALYLETSRSSAELGLQPHVSFVRINSTIAVAAYKGGSVDIWSTLLAREPIHHYQHSQDIQAIAIASDAAVIATSSSYQVRLESSDERGYWHKAYQFELQKLVSDLQLVPDVLSTKGNETLVAAAEDTVYVLKPDAEPKVIHSIYGNTVTCLDVSINQIACGVRNFGWIMSDGNKVHIYCLQTARPLATLSNAAGDFTCINLRDSPPHLAVTGNKDRKVRVYDLRTNKAVTSLDGHQLGVSCVQMDDWKIVSGGEEGLVCVWEQRMGTKLWEMHSRHPVRHLRFAAHILITANIPNEKYPRGASIMDDDLTAHRRHRGIISVYDFSVNKSAPVLPICRSSYDEDVGYNYNITLSMPYDQIK